MARLCSSCNLRDLRHLVTFEKPVTVDDGAGGNTTTWVKDRACRAKIEPLSGKERVHALALEHPVSHRLTIRYSATTAAYHRDGLARRRINFKGRLMKIVAIIDLEERNQWLEISAMEGSAV